MQKTLVVNHEINIDKTTIQQLCNDVSEESQVIVHCCYTELCKKEGIAVEKSTFLYARNSSQKSKMIFCENIPLIPASRGVDLGETINFTLIFKGLPKHCEEFDLIEKTSNRGAFIVRNIIRNNSDVYLIDLTEII